MAAMAGAPWPSCGTWLLSLRMLLLLVEEEEDLEAEVEEVL
jgi:hypothetical protein